MKSRISQKDVKMFMLIFVTFIFSVGVSWLLCIFFGITPFVSYDDFHLYYKFRPDNIESIQYYLEQRQIFAVIAAYLNEFLFVNEWINGTRVFNVLIGFLTVLECGKLCDRMGYKRDKKCIMLFLSASPLIVFWIGSLYKDGLCAYLTIKLLIAFADLIAEKKVKFIPIIAESIVLYFIRAGIVEVLLVFAFLYYMRYNRGKVKYVVAILTIVLGMSLFLEFSKVYLDVLGHKFSAYIYAETVETGMLALIRINSLGDFWKLPLCVLFLQLSPIPTIEIADTVEGLGWWNVISFLSVFQFILVPGFWYYVIKVKKSVIEKFILLFYLFWLCFIAVTELNSVRFYVFAMPLFYIFSIHGFRMTENKQKKILLVISAGFVFLWLLLVIRALM